jgi:hypothetical protein
VFYTPYIVRSFAHAWTFCSWGGECLQKKTTLSGTSGTEPTSRLVFGRIATNERLGGFEMPEVQPGKSRLGHQAVHQVEQVLELPALPHGGREVDVHVVPREVDVLVPRRGRANRGQQRGVRFENRCDGRQVFGELADRGSGVPLPGIGEEGLEGRTLGRPRHCQHGPLVRLPGRARQGLSAGQARVEEGAPLLLAHHLTGRDVAHEGCALAGDGFDIDQLPTPFREARDHLLPHLRGASPPRMGASLIPFSRRAKSSELRPEGDGRHWPSLRGV